MFAKSDVTGESANPLFQRLGDLGEPTWNFNKYLLDRKGQVVEHYEQGTGPEDPELNARIDELLYSRASGITWLTSRGSAPWRWTAIAGGSFPMRS